ARCSGCRWRNWMKQLSVLAMCALMIATAMPVAAQQRPAQTQKDTTQKRAPIPADARPPKGMCRIWIENVPAAQQPAATDCPTAIKNLPANGRVIFGDEYSDTARGKT